MLNNKWFCEPNSYRETYCFFLLETGKVQSKITRWIASIGNIDEITNSKIGENKDEHETLMLLIPVLFYCRKNHLTIITDKNKTFSTLRTRLAIEKIEDADISSIRVVTLEEYITKYFSYNGKNDLLSWCEFFSIDTKGKSKTEIIKSIFERIKPLIPAGV